MSVCFFTQDVSFKLKDKRKIKKWISQIAELHGKVIGNINIIFTSDENIKQINQKYLNHNYFTDIITFNDNSSNILNGDLFISIDTVKNNAVFYSKEMNNELLRVIIHGILHLIGINDKSKEEFQKMKNLEDISLSIYFT